MVYIYAIVVEFGVVLLPIVIILAISNTMGILLIAYCALYIYAAMY